MPQPKSPITPVMLDGNRTLTVTPEPGHVLLTILGAQGHTHARFRMDPDQAGALQDMLYYAESEARNQ